MLFGATNLAEREVRPKKNASAIFDRTNLRRRILTDFSSSSSRF
jgi:hypothetical protein